MIEKHDIVHSAVATGTGLGSISAALLTDIMTMAQLMALLGGIVLIGLQIWYWWLKVQDLLRQRRRDKTP